MNIDDSGPAFPEHDWVEENGDLHFKTIHSGMTLRDYFAAKAMQAQITHYGCMDKFEILSKQSYEIADAMLKERDK